MFARVTIATGLPGKAEELLRIERDSIVPACKTQKGMTITLWETAADMRAAELSGFYQQQVAKVKDVIAAPPVREEYEVSLAP